MARPKELGIDYFTLNVDFFDDPKLLFISNRFEEKGELVVIKLLCWIYKHNGYYSIWNDEIAMLFAKRAFANIKYSLVNDIVNELIKRDFFNREMFDSFGILTSSGIQKRWIEATKRRRTGIKPEFDLIGLCSETYTITRTNNTETPVKHTETTSQTTIIGQSKVKESKVNNKESKKEKTLFPDRLKEQMKKQAPEEYPEEVLSLAYDISNFLNVPNPSKGANYGLPFSEIKCFTENLYRWGEFNVLKDQFKFYKMARKEPKYRHGHKKFIGNIDLKYQDGAWNEKDWKSISGVNETKPKSYAEQIKRLNAL